jgi:hypothetical protein
VLQLRAYLRPSHPSAPRVGIPSCLAAAACAAILGLAPPAHAQQPPCDQGILSLAGGGQPYAGRGDRCEGTYRQEIGAGLYLRSIYQTFDTFNLTTTRDPLVIEWSPPPGRAVTVRADGWVGGEPYRMDATPARDSSSFTWQTRVLRALSAGSREPLTRDALGIQAWTDSAGARLFLPIRVWQTTRRAPCGPVSVVLWVMSRPDSVFVEVGAVDGTGATQSAGRRELGRRPYPLKGPVTFTLPEITRSGIYRLTLAAGLGQDTWTRHYLIYVGDATRLACS